MLCVAHVARVRLRKVRDTQPGGHKEMISILADQIDSDNIARTIKARNTATGYCSNWLKISYHKGVVTLAIFSLFQAELITLPFLESLFFLKLPKKFCY
jgi:hypothetical protein